MVSLGSEGIDIVLGYLHIRLASHCYLLTSIPSLVIHTRKTHPFFLKKIKKT